MRGGTQQLIPAWAGNAPLSSISLVLTPVHPRVGGERYLLRGLDIDRPDQVWCADITCATDSNSQGKGNAGAEPVQALDIIARGRQISSTRAINPFGAHLVLALKLSNKAGPPQGIRKRIIDLMRQHNNTSPDLVADNDHFPVRLWKTPPHSPATDIEAGAIPRAAT